MGAAGETVQCTVCGHQTPVGQLWCELCEALLPSAWDRCRRLLSARKAELEAQLPEHGGPSPLWMEYYALLRTLRLFAPDIPWRDVFDHD